MRCERGHAQLHAVREKRWFGNLYGLRGNAIIETIERVDATID